MGLFVVLFWCAAVTRAVLRHNSRNSRFGVFNSRLGANKFPFRRQRELPSKGLIGFAILGAKTALFENNRENSRFDGNYGGFHLQRNRELAVAPTRTEPEAPHRRRLATITPRLLLCYLKASKY
jgi:hypothetical protein